MLQNTMDIVNQGCSTENGGITAAQAALDAEIKGYSDWYLPSIDELTVMYYTLAIQANWRWSSSELHSTYAWQVNFDNDFIGDGGINSSASVRVIRSF